jgi:hypothetical protein
MSGEQEQPVTEAGVYQAMDPVQLERLHTQYELMMEENRANGKKWTQHYQEYEKLR